MTSRISLRTVSGVLTLSLALLLATPALAQDQHVEKAGKTAAAKLLRLKLSDLRCERCAASIQAELAKVPGVKSATVSSKSQSATITPGKITPTPAALKKAVEKAEYKVVSVTTDGTAQK